MQNDCRDLRMLAKKVRKKVVEDGARIEERGLWNWGTDVKVENMAKKNNNIVFGMLLVFFF